jgi:hypothetical protein
MKQPAKKVIRWKRIVGVPIGLGLDSWNDMQAAEIECVVVVIHCILAYPMVNSINVHSICSA